MFSRVGDDVKEGKRIKRKWLHGPTSSIYLRPPHLYLTKNNNPSKMAFEINRLLAGENTEKRAFS